jgi:hypothetical protein
MSEDPNGRFHLVESPAQQPGNDFITGNGQGPFIDTGKNVSFNEGKFQSRVYLSVESVREMAEVAGLFDGYEKKIEDAEQAGLAQGYADGVKENFSGDIRGAADSVGFAADALRRVADRLDLGDAVGGEESEPSLVGVLEDLAADVRESRPPRKSGRRS